MFGNLFSENVPQQQSGVQGPVLSIPSPPGPRLQCGLAGIDNQGSTCYLNSLLQTLFLTPEFRDRLFSLSDTELGCLNNTNNPSCRVRVIPLQLQRIFSQLLLSDQQSVSTTDLTNSFGWTNREEFQQHDVQELNRILFSAIEESLVGTTGQNILNELYHGTIVNQITCTKCKKISGREEDFLDLTLAVAGQPGLEAALRQCYCEVEKMDGKNQYKCETCQAYTDATKGAKLRNLPPVLTLSLLRFSYDLTKMTRYKENGRFTFPFDLDMSPYSEKGSVGDPDCQYELFSVVVHRGSAFGGHYFAYIRDIDNIGHWTPPETSPKVDPNTTGLDVIECQSPVDLIENILSKVSHGCMSVDKLCSEITKVTGVSWSKHFRKTHGPINKFLKSCDSFVYNPDSNWVSLRVSGGPKEDRQKEVSGSTPVTDCTLPVPNNNIRSIKKNLDDTPDEGYRWFSFNDSSVCPVFTRDIEKQFSGKESAYMLFYRKKSLCRPKEAQGSASYNIPFHLIKEVEDLNAALEKERQNYDIAVNKICVKVFLCTSFIKTDLLQLKPDITTESAMNIIEIDRRKAFQELRLLIHKLFEQFDVSEFSVYRMKPRCGGFHLYEELKDEERILQSLDITSSTHLFVKFSDGQLKENLEEIGEHCEPVQFLVKNNEDDVMACVTLAKNKSPAELYQLVTNNVDLPVHLLQKTGCKQIETIPNSSDTTIDALGLKDGDILVIVQLDSNESKPSGETKIETVISSDSPNVDPDWSITLQSRLYESTSHTCKTIKFQSRSTSTIKEVKLRAMHLLNLENVSFDTVRLREDHKTLGLQPPLREGLTVVDAGLTNGVCLVLESGRSPQDFEMTVTVNKMMNGKLVCKKEFLVDRQLSVMGMLQAACKLMDCGNSQWYLSKTDMYGDSVEPLDDPTVTLMEALINDGDTLVLQQGTLIKKDQIALTLWLAPTFPTQSQIDGLNGSGDILHRREEEDKVMLELAAKLSLSDQKEVNLLMDCLCPNNMEPLYESLVINKSMGVDELKQALMDLDSFKTMRIPTCHFMRLRQLDTVRLRGVLRSNSLLFKHAGLRETIPLAVQILNSEETLGVHEVLLLIAQKIGSTRIYMPPRELIWNTSGGMGAGDLKRAIATRLSLPLHDVAIAKYNPETFTWSVLKDQPQKVGKNKGKKKSSGHKTNIKQAPYYVQDGDLIGVKILSLDKGILEVDDFSTQEDLNHLQQLKLIAEEKKRIREEKKLDSQDCFTAPRRQEVPLTIKVDKFS
uniref:USP domain-containing protein n=1 Tax=Biomphalaria glabrata TaxID=6526 RepID=A0A2C9JXG3_BIOGL